MEALAKQGYDVLFIPTDVADDEFRATVIAQAVAK